MVLEVSSKNSTLTWVTPPLEPVLPRTLMTLAKVTGVFESILLLCVGDGSRGRDWKRCEMYFSCEGR